MKTQVAFPGARGADSYPFSIGGTEKQALMLAKDFDFFVGYLGSMNATRLNWILDAGMAFMPVTKAGEYKDGAMDELNQLFALGIPKGTTVWLDLEGIDAWNTPAAQLIALIEAWARDITAAGYMAGLYVGAPQPLTGPQLYALKGITRYWLGIGRCVGRSATWKPSADQKQLDAYPDCGWCMRQDWHGEPDADIGLKGGILWPPRSHVSMPNHERVFVDTNGIQVDHKGRLPVWVVR